MFSAVFLPYNRGIFVVPVSYPLFGGDRGWFFEGMWRETGVLCNLTKACREGIREKRKNLKIFASQPVSGYKAPFAPDGAADPVVFLHLHLAHCFSSKLFHHRKRTALAVLFLWWRQLESEPTLASLGVQGALRARRRCRSCGFSSLAPCTLLLIRTIFAIEKGRRLPSFFYGGDSWNRTNDLMHVKHAL